MNAPHISLGYVRLTDAAPLIMAQELGLYARHGIDVSLQRERRRQRHGAARRAHRLPLSKFATNSARRNTYHRAPALRTWCSF